MLSSWRLKNKPKSELGGGGGLPRPHVYMRISSMVTSSSETFIRCMQHMRCDSLHALYVCEKLFLTTKNLSSYEDRPIGHHKRIRLALGLVAQMSV